MRTTIEIDSDLMLQALKATGLKTEREVVELGLRTLLRLAKEAEIRKLRSKVRWQGDHDTVRSNKGPSSTPNV